MDLISNTFSLLALDDGDVPSTSATTTTNGDTESNGKNSNDKADMDIANNKEKKLGVLASEYKLPLVWIDLEMTGLNIEVDRIIEIACIITDGSLSKSVEGPDLVIHQSQECMDKMGEWCQDHHGASGLTEKVLKSTISEAEAELQVIEFVKRHVGTHKPLLAGNSVYMDLIFLKGEIVMLVSGKTNLRRYLKMKYMPDLASIFSHVLVDVSSVKALCIRWYPKAYKKAPTKEQKHRALDDIRESILELKYYKENIFRASKK